MSAPHIGSAVLGVLPRVVLAVAGDSVAVEEAVRSGVHILEARIDLSGRRTADEVRALVEALRRHGLPIIATVRGPNELAGAPDLSDGARADLYAAVADVVDAVDVDVRSPTVVARVRDIAAKHGVQLILSFHDFAATPDATALDATVATAVAAGANITKIAALARSAADVEALLQVMQRHRGQPLVVIAMGPIGALSRLAFPMFGSLLTYTNVAPTDGQIPLETMMAQLRYYYPGLRDS